MVQYSPRKASALFAPRFAWLRTERAVSKAALVVAALGFGLSLLIALLGR